MVKNRTKLLSYTLPLTLVLALGCGNSPPEGSASASASSTGGSGTSGSASNSDSDPTPGSNSNSDSTPTTTQGSLSEGQTEATTAATTGTASVASITDTSATSNPTSDTDGTTTGGDTSTTGGDTSTTGTSTGDLTASTGGSTTGGSSSTGDGTTGTTGEPVQCGLQLKATIRDFKLGHPDFETYCCGLVQGLVKPDLGADKKPVFNQVGNPKMLTDAPTFNQWYNNVPDINQSTQIVLDLMEIQPGVYSYQNNNFFPIDNMLFGNQGNNHNFHFTTQINSSFTYTGGESFTFTGDDDVWVFINKKLVIDIGGVHGNSPGTIDLDTLGLSMGNTYSLDVFHAERHTTQSNFRIDTTICSVPQ